MRSLARGHWINLHTTDNCNLNCRYCYFKNKSIQQPSYDLALLPKLVTMSPDPVTICFYGGEPTLNIPFMLEVVKILKNIPCSFAIQSNGTKLSQIPDELLEQFVGIGISIDGQRHITDYNRGKGVFDTIIGHVKLIADRVKVPIMARMTINEHNDLISDFATLMQHFDALYWQIDNDLGTRDYQSFQNQYCAILPKIVDTWEEHARSGRVINLIPFFGVYWLLTRPPKPSNIYYHCEPGGGSITIDASGTIFSCPEGIYRGRKQIGGHDILGVIGDTNMAYPIKRHPQKTECKNCEIFAICAGRCIWTHEDPYCACTHALVETVKENASRMWQYLDYPSLQRMHHTILTTEIIP